MSKKELILKLAAYKIIPLFAILFAAITLLLEIKPIHIEDGILGVSITVEGLTITTIAVYLTKKILDLDIKEKPSSQST